MSKIEKEIKILGIDIKETKRLLEELGAEEKGKKEQKIYVYDVPTLYYRYLEIRDLINLDSEMIINTMLGKLEVLLVELNDLIDDDDLYNVIDSFNISSLDEINRLPVDRIKEILNDDLFNNVLKKFYINPNKWIRLRKSNDKVELTVKHILEKKSDKFQNVVETEIKVSSLEEANEILRSIGVVRRSYQEKIRYSYEYKDAEIEIDMWPMLEPYMEIECDDEELIEKIIEKLNLKDKEIVSLNTEQLYKKIGIDIHNVSELKF